MNSQSSLEEFNEYYDMYDQGLYTENELVSKIIELLDEGNEALWNELPKDMKEEVLKFLESFNEEDELVSFGGVDSEQAKIKLIKLKGWVRAKT